MDKIQLFKLFFIWNKSKIRDFDFCPNFFRLRYLNKVNISDKKIIEGLSIHDIISKYYKEKKEIKDFSLLNNTSIKKYLPNFIDFEIKRKKENYKIIVVEKTFNTFVYLKSLKISDELYKYLNRIGNKIIINGKIDLLLKKDDKFYIVDFKTGKNKEDYYYIWLSYNSLNIKTDLITVNLLNNEKEKIFFSKEKVEKYGKQLIEKISLIVEELYKFLKTGELNKNKEKCTFCSFKNFCKK